MQHWVQVFGVPEWVPVGRLLGPADWKPGEHGTFESRLDTAHAADLAARLRGVALGGNPVHLEIGPRLKRPAVRRGRSDEARRMRDTTPGFTKAGARLDDVGRLSLTPESLASKLGRQAKGRNVTDACCGCGGNAIGFARAGCQVVAIEPDPQRLAMARHNARLYGVADRIRFIEDRAENVLSDGDLLFIDPPWGDYPRDGCVASDLPVLETLLALADGFTSTWVKVPPAFDPETTPDFRPEAWFGEADGDRRRVKFVLLRR